MPGSSRQLLVAPASRPLPTGREAIDLAGVSGNASSNALMVRRNYTPPGGLTMRGGKRYVTAVARRAARGGNMTVVWKRTKWMVTGLGLGVIVGGCASATVQTENLLGQAGFRRLPADTPAKVAHLSTLPPGKVVGREYQGKKYYVFSDPADCKC